MAIVRNQSLDPAGRPVPVIVVAELVTGAVSGAGYAGDSTVIHRVHATAGPDGRWEFDLAPNATITPANTHYRIIERAGAREYTHTVIVPAGGPHRLVDILAVPPPAPTPLVPVGGGGGGGVSSVDQRRGDVTLADLYSGTGHDHDERYPGMDHRHDGVYSQVGHKHLDYSPADHEHDDRYSALGHGHADLAPAGHNHDARYSSASHNHDGVYSPTDHLHDGRYALGVHNHDAVYAALDHLHTGVYSPAGHVHDDRYSLTTHNHDTTYAALGHLHTGVYSPAGHTHDERYALGGHNHDTAYAALVHAHTGVYATSAHVHDERYSLTGHNHDAAYAALGHLHTGVYSPAGHGHDAAAITSGVLDRARLPADPLAQYPVPTRWAVVPPLGTTASITVAVGELVLVPFVVGATFVADQFSADSAGSATDAAMRFLVYGSTPGTYQPGALVLDLPAQSAVATGAKLWTPDPGGQPGTFTFTPGVWWLGLLAQGAVVTVRGCSSWHPLVHTDTAPAGTGTASGYTQTVGAAAPAAFTSNKPRSGPRLAVRAA